MALILPVKGKYPVFGENCFFAPNSTIVGDVEMGSSCSVWFNAVVRGDVNSIVMGDKVNVQDGAVIHCTYLKTKTIIGNNVSIGHNAIVHGCKIGNNVLIGMGAIVMDDAIIEENVLVAAGAVVLEKSSLKTGFIYAGVPAKPIKQLTAEQFQHYVERIANNYTMYADWFK